MTTVNLQGWCVQCSRECNIWLPDDVLPEEGDVMYQAECASHSNKDSGELPAEELEPLPADALAEIRRKSTVRRKRTVCCFEVG